MDQAKHHDVVIVGSGPAGYTAAIYTARAGLHPLVLEGMELGGALMGTGAVQNFPGFPDGVLGPELMGKLRTQAQNVGADLQPRDVLSVTCAGDIKTIRTGDAVYTADAVILAMGARARTLGLPAEAWAAGNGLSTCATCDGFFYRDKPVAVVGGGDAAVEEAITLSRLASSVLLVHRREQLRASKVLQDELARTGTRTAFNTVVVDILDEPTVTGVRLVDVRDRTETVVDVDGLFVAIGQHPRSDLVKGQVELTETGHVVVGTTTMTSASGVFACGDLVDATYRQAITAAGSGCQAALDAERWLMHHVGQSRGR